MTARVVWRAVGAFCVLWASLFAGGALAEPARAVLPRSPKLMAFEEQIVRELKAESPEAAAAFVEGSEARDRDDFASARVSLQRAHDLLPRSPHPLRRLCLVELRLDARDVGIRHCRDAVALDESATNLSALAMALADSGGSADKGEAFRLAERAFRLDPNDEIVVATYARVALASENRAAFGTAMARLGLIDPDSATTAYLRAIDAAMNGEWSAADEQLDRAKAAGMPAQAVESLRARMHDAQPFYLRAWRVLKVVFGAWLFTALFLVLGGLLLSHAAMRAAGNLPADATGHARGTDAQLRRAYRALLWLSCAFYYASIPLVLGIVLLLGGGIIVGFFAVGTIPIKLVLIIGVVVVTTLSAVVKSLFVRPKESEPGTLLDLEEHPKLRGVLAEVASRVGTRPVDCVYLTPGTDIAVFERGGMWSRVRGARSERCLVLGVGVLQGMRLVDFKAVLAHEHGHFQNEDTAGGGFALAVRRSVLLTAVALAQGGVATWYNPAWWFVRGFFLLFLRISHGASRLQEILADRWAAFTYGAEAFERGLRHAIVRSAVFESEASAKLNEVIEAKCHLANIYTYEPKTPVEEGEIAEVTKHALKRKASPYDSHPAPLERIALVRNLRGTPVVEDDMTEALDVFGDRDQIECLMTEKVRSQVYAQIGVRIPAQAGAKS